MGGERQQELRLQFDLARGAMRADTPIIGQLSLTGISGELTLPLSSF
jgi:hypothetical protein